MDDADDDYDGLPPPLPSELLEDELQDVEPGETIEFAPGLRRDAELRASSGGNIAGPANGSLLQDEASAEKLDTERSRKSTNECSLEDEPLPEVRSKHLFVTRKGELSPEFWAQFLEEQFIISTRHDAKRWKKQMWQLTHETGRRTLVYTYSIAALLHMRRVQFILFLISLLSIGQVFYFSSVAINQATTASSFRFTALELRRTHLLHINNVGSIGATSDECIFWADNYTVADGTITVSYPWPVSMNGFAFRLVGAVEEDPVRWRVEAMAAGGGWEPIFRDVTEAWALEPTQDRGSEDALRVLSNGFWGDVVASYLACAGILLTTGLAVIGRNGAAKRAMSVSLGAVAVTFLLAEASDGEFRPSLSRWGHAVIIALLAPCLVLGACERFLAQALMVAGVVGWVFLGLTSASAEGDGEGGGQRLYRQQQQVIMSALLGAGLLLFVYRRVVVVRLNRRIGLDTEAFDSNMMEAMGRCLRGDDDLDDFRRAIDAMAGCARCGRHACSIPTHEVVQTSLVSAEAAIARQEGKRPWWKGRLPWEAREAKLVRNLEQLYAQASCQTHILRDKCKELALESNGLFPLEGRPARSQTQGTEKGAGGWRREYRRWAEIKSDPIRAELVQWTRLKPYKRAMDKVVYHLDGEAARLLDVCREMIVFDTFKDIATCLRQIKSDPEIVLQRAINTLDASDDASRSGGFRAVFVKLLLVTEVSKRLATTPHVCELVLTLRCVAELVSDDSHADYLLLRRLQDAAPDRAYLKPVQVHHHLKTESEEGAENRYNAENDGGYDGSQADDAMSTGSSQGGGSLFGGSPLFGAFRRHPPRRPNRIFPDPASPLGQPSSPSMTATIPIEPLPSNRRHGEGLGGGGGGGARTAWEAGSENNSPTAAVRRRGGLTSRSASPDGGDMDRRPSTASAASDMSRQLSTEERLEAVFAREFRKRCTLEGGDLDQWWSHLGEATATANFAKVFNTSFPISSAMGKRWFIAFMLVIGALSLFISLQYLAQENVKGFLEVTTVRFTVHELRGGVTAGNGSGFSEHVLGLGLGLKRAGCRTVLAEHHAARTRVEAEEEATSVVVDLVNVTTLDGFFFSTHATDASLDPAVFGLEVRGRGGGGWELAGTSRKFVERSGRVRWPLEAAKLPEGRGEEVEVGLGLPVYALVRVAVSPALIGVASWLLLALSVLADYDWGKPTICATVLITAGCHALETAGRVLDSTFTLFPLQAITSAELFFFAGVVYWREKYFMEGLTLTAMTLMACAAAEDFALDYDPWRFVDQIASAFVVVVGVVLLVVRHVSRHRAVRSIMQDYQLYQAVWARIREDPDEVKAMSRFPYVLARAPLAPSSRLIRQEMQTLLPPSLVAKHKSASDPSLCAPSSSTKSSSSAAFPWRPLLEKFLPNPLRKARGRRGSAVSSVMGPSKHGSDAGRFMARSVSFLKRTQGLNKRVPVTSLKLLYTQAAGLHPIVECKAKQWALQSRGRFPVRRPEGGAEFVLWETAANDWWTERNIRWPPLKKAGRAIEKLVRTYGGAVWMVQDLVRQSIVFERSAELLKCLETIVDDADVEVIGAKNRLRPDYNPLSSAGYRDVHLNLRLRTPQAEALGVECHVFEIQLQLSAYAGTKVSGGHRRYVAFRNALCM